MGNSHTLDELYNKAADILINDFDLFLDAYYGILEDTTGLITGFDYPALHSMGFYKDWVKDNNLENDTDFQNADKNGFDTADSYYIWWHDFAENALISFDYPDDYFSELFRSSEIDGSIYDDIIEACVQNNDSLDDEEFDAIIRAIRQQKKIVKESKGHMRKKALKESVNTSKVREIADALDSDLVDTDIEFDSEGLYDYVYPEFFNWLTATTDGTLLINTGAGGLLPEIHFIKDLSEDELDNIFNKKDVTFSCAWDSAYALYCKDNFVTVVDEDVLSEDIGNSFITIYLAYVLCDDSIYNSMINDTSQQLSADSKELLALISEYFEL